MTPSKEDYIKAIHSLNGAREIVSNKDLSQALGVSAASVTDMNTRLVGEDLIDYTPYQGVKLTDLGSQIARKLIRKHRLWETFLYEKLDYDWTEVHDEADRLEHVSSDQLVDRLDAYLGFPKTDPHGGLIPDKDGNIEHKYTIPLLGAKPGEVFTVLEINDDPEILRYVFDRGVVPGTVLTLVNIDDLEGPLTVRNENDDEIIISYKAAGQIFIELKED